MFRIRRLFKSFRYALNGFIKTFHEEQNLQIQTLSALVVLLLAWYFRLERWEWGLLIFTIGLVMFAELVNSAVERIADVLKPRINIYVKVIKDVTAAAVMLASLVAIIIGLIIFWPHIF